MRALLLPLAAAAVLASGCGSADEPAKTQNIAVRSAEQNALHQLDDMNRNIGLKRAIVASGMPCKRVTESGYVREHENLSMWMARCDEKREWAIFVGPDGTAQVRPCQDMKDLGLPQCVMAADRTGREARAAAGEVKGAPAQAGAQ